MANYRYHVITPAGKEKKGIITASDRPHAMAVLKNDGNTVISIDAPSIWDKEFELPFLNPGVRPRDMSVFCRQFVTLTESGISIVRAMEMLEEQTVNKLLKEAKQEILQAHNAQTKVIQAQVSGEQFEYSLLFVHAQDTVMTITTELRMVQKMEPIFKALYQRSKGE